LFLPEVLAGSFWFYVEEDDAKRRSLKDRELPL
jgi:hypothetical protein